MNNSRHSKKFSIPVMRSISIAYVGIMIVLPILAITMEAFHKGWAVVLRNILTPQSLFSLKLTFVMAIVLVLINIVTGTAMAWVLVRYRFPFKNLINALIDLPFAIPTVVTGMMLVALYGPNSAIGLFLSKMGIEIIYARPGIVLALLYVTFPFVVRAVQPVLMEMDLDMEEAARTLGASPLTVFGRIVIPTLLPAILTGTALSFSRALGEFGSIAIVAGNIPFRTQVSSVYIYGEIESYNPQGALGVSLVLLGCALVILILLNLVQQWSRRHELAV